MNENHMESLNLPFRIITLMLLNEWIHPYRLDTREQDLCELAQTSGGILISETLPTNPGILLQKNITFILLQ